MTPHTIFIHCTATRPNFMEAATTADRVAEIRRWHTDPKPKGRDWKDIGYHYLIDRDGTEATGRPETQQGAHALGHNKDTIAISLFGGHGSSENDAFSDNFTPEQDANLRRLIDALKKRYPSIKHVRGHNEVAAKACPGFRVSRWLEGRAPARTSPAQSKTNLSVIGGALATISMLSDAAKAAIGTVTETFGVTPEQAQAIVILFLLGYIGIERMRKWRAGDR